MVSFDPSSPHGSTGPINLAQISLLGDCAQSPLLGAILRWAVSGASMYDPSGGMGWQVAGRGIGSERLDGTGH